ncbi:MAG: L,D-transpeptidase [Desulfobaccales bacterium]
MRYITMILLVVLLGVLAVPAWGEGPFQVRLPVQQTGIDPEADNVVGSPQRHIIGKGETLLDVARDHGLGYQELAASYRHWDPFIPPTGAEIVIPTRWIVPENHKRNQIIVNTGDMRLYYYTNNATQVYTFPIGMGVLDFETPAGVFQVVDKRVHPAWHIPQSLQKKYGMAVMAPGPDNPLGDYKLTLSWGDYGIHGTHMPWGVGRMVSHGCTRMYPEHIKQLFPMVPVGAKVEYVYEPAKIGFHHGRIYLSVHEDVYFKIRSMILHVLSLLEKRGLASRVDMQRVLQAVEEQNGVAVDITKM